MKKHDKIRKAAKLLLDAGLFLAVEDYETNTGMYSLTTPDEVVEHVAKNDAYFARVAGMPHV